MIPCSIPYACPVLYVTAKTILKALYDYDPRQSDDLGFKKGDRLELLSDRCVIVIVMPSQSSKPL